jgi:hypothetical protein
VEAAGDICDLLDMLRPFRERFPDVYDDCWLAPMTEEEELADGATLVIIGGQFVRNPNRDQTQ